MYTIEISLHGRVSKNRRNSTSHDARQNSRSQVTTKFIRQVLMHIYICIINSLIPSIFPYIFGQDHPLLTGSQNKYRVSCIRKNIISY